MKKGSIKGEIEMKSENGLLTYLKWRGDLSVEQAPFNDVDALALCELVYVEFDGVVPEQEDEGTVTLKEAFRKYERKPHKTTVHYQEKEELFEILAQSPRYENMVLSNYVSKVDTIGQEQFAAIHIEVSPNLTVIAFRGTDNTIVGWKEDFNMSYMMPVPSQQSAVEYVNHTVRGILKNYWFAGHSKGGNLALYSGVYCNKKVQKKIARINSFDGPGFSRKVVNEPEYMAVKDKISAYVPVASIVGMLFEHEESYKVVDSSEPSIKQHDGLSWQVDRDRFVLKDKVDERSSNLAQVLKAWINQMDNEEKKAFIDAFFGIFEKAGIDEPEEILNMDILTMGSLVKDLVNLPPEIREAVTTLIKMLIEEGKNRPIRM